MPHFKINNMFNEITRFAKAVFYVAACSVINAVSGGNGAGGGAPKKISVGGQALIEGMLMIGPRKVAIAIRKPDNEIELKVDPVAPKTLLQKIPLIRGAVNLFRQMKIGVGALMYSAQYMEIEEEADKAAGGSGGQVSESGVKNVSESENANISAKANEAGGSSADGLSVDGSVADGSSADSSAASGTAGGGADGTANAPAGAAAVETSRFERFLDEKFGDKAKDIIIYLAVVLSLCFSVGLFILLPNFIAGFIPLNKSQRSGLIILNLCEGCIRVGLFLGYLALTSRLQEIDRLWQYHGAEHKTIHCYEHGDPVQTGYVRKYPVKHPRCGTSFLFLVMIISILVFSLVDLAALNMRLQLTGALRVLFALLIRLIAIPLVAGAAYEVIKISGRYNNAFTRVISAPGMFFQRFTTKEPNDGMIEVAIKAFENAVSEDENEMAW